MANDREVLRIVWEGQLPVCFQADSDEIAGLQQPNQFYLMVSRLSYLPLVTDKVKKYFNRYIANDQQDGNVWFDFNGIPLKLHYPIGVLYDLHHSEDDELPWCLTIHFSKFPEDVLVKFATKDILEAHFMSCLKEADVLKHRGQVISAMQKKDHNQLWLGLVNDKFDQFWAVNRRLMEPTGDHETFKHIPVRFYNEDGTYVQKLIAPLNESGQKRTVQDLLTEFSTPVRHAGLIEDCASGLNEKLERTSNWSPSGDLVLNPAKFGIRTHGIDIHTDTPLQWMSEHLSYPDNFLHLFINYENV